jgi:hypothetical protein
MSGVDTLKYYAEINEVPFDLAYALANQESGLNHYWNDGSVKVSPAGAIGFMQLMPETAAGLGVNPWEEEENIRGGMNHISTLLKSYNGDIDLTLAAYNAGSGAVAKYGGIPPYAETQNYVSSIKAAMANNRIDPYPDDNTFLSAAPLTLKDKVKNWFGGVKNKAGNAVTNTGKAVTETKEKVSNFFNPFSPNNLKVIAIFGIVVIIVIAIFSMLKGGNESEQYKTL